MTCSPKVHTKRTVAFPLQQWSCERVTLLRYTYVAHPFVDRCGYVVQGLEKVRKIFSRRCLADRSFTLKLTNINNESFRQLSLSLYRAFCSFFSVKHKQMHIYSH